MQSFKGYIPVQIMKGHAGAAAEASDVICCLHNPTLYLVPQPAVSLSWCFPGDGGSLSISLDGEGLVACNGQAVEAMPSARLLQGREGWGVLPRGSAPFLVA